MPRLGTKKQARFLNSVEERMIERISERKEDSTSCFQARRELLSKNFWDRMTESQREKLIMKTLGSSYRKLKEVKWNLLPDKIQRIVLDMVQL